MSTVKARNTMLAAINDCEAMLDEHPDLMRCTEAGRETEIAFDRNGWTVRMHVKRRDARGNAAWQKISESGDTLVDVVARLESSLDTWAVVLK